MDNDAWDTAALLNDKKKKSAKFNSGIFILSKKEILDFSAQEGDSCRYNSSYNLVSCAETKCYWTGSI